MAFDIAAVVIMVPVFVRFIALPCLAYCENLDCLALIEEPRDWSHWARYKWLKWDVQRL